MPTVLPGRFLLYHHRCDAIDRSPREKPTQNECQKRLLTSPINPGTFFVLTTIPDPTRHIQNENGDGFFCCAEHQYGSSKSPIFAKRIVADKTRLGCVTDSGASKGWLSSILKKGLLAPRAGVRRKMDATCSPKVPSPLTLRI